MTIDNHPLTPKPVDDREVVFQVTQGDRDLFRELERFVVQGYGGPLLDGEAIEVIARHREQAERGLREALREIARLGVDMNADFSRSADQSRIARKALDTRP